MNREHHSIGLRTLEDISTIILHSHDLQETLDNIVNIVAKRMGSDVCSIYLLEDDGETLTLMATRGLSRSAVGKITMKTSEGLTGLVAEQRALVMTDNAPAHPRYKYFKESKEERFFSFLGLPLFERKTPIGVIVIQTKEPRTFAEEEISTLRTITFQIASIVNNARLLDSIQKKEQERARYEKELEDLKQLSNGSEAATGHDNGSSSRVFPGIAVSPGFCSGRIYILDRYSDKVLKVTKIGSRKEEEKKLNIAVEKVKIHTLYMEKRVSETLSADDAAIFHTHLMILEDRGFTGRMLELVQEGSGAHRAVHETVQHYVEAFNAIEDQYLRERAADVEDIGRRLIDALEGNEPETVKLKERRVIVAEDIYPSDLAMLDHEKILGIVTEKGNRYSHAAIMAKSLGIPAVVGINGLLHEANPKDEIIVDGTSGHVYLNPDRAIRTEYNRLENDFASRRKGLEELKELPAITTDGVIISLKANIGLISDIRVAQANGAEGVGLYRTEFPYMARSSFPTREEQSALYRKILQGFPDRQVTIRTLDIGGDKGLPYFPFPAEDNPFLGWRSIRVSLDRQDIFREQLAAILLASTAGNPAIMFPLIPCVDEILLIKRIIDSVKEELVLKGHEINEDIPVGIMVELPAAVQTAHILAREVDFFSIGTNDLIQYTLAADRNNPLVKQYYEPLHPAILHSIRQVCDAARKAGKKISLCGEMASEPINAMLLAGMGIRDFSLSAPSIPSVKEAFRSHSLETCRLLAKKALSLTSSSAVRSFINEERHRLFPGQT